MEQGINTKNVSSISIHKMGELSMLHYTTVLGRQQSGGTKGEDHTFPCPCANAKLWSPSLDGSKKSTNEGFRHKILAPPCLG